MLQRFNSVGRLQIDCPYLEHLCLANIDNVELPTGLEACRSLAKLDLCGSSDGNLPTIEALSAFVLGLKSSLLELDVSSWGLTEIPRQWTALTRLQVLKAECNRLRFLPLLPRSLRVVLLARNNFTDVQSSLELLTNLRTLKLSSQYLSGSLQITRPLTPFLKMPSACRQSCSQTMRVSRRTGLLSSGLPSP